MQPIPDPALRRLEWLSQFGVEARDLPSLNLCVPGEFTLPGAIYVNTGSPRVIYRGTEEGTLPMVAGRWYLIPAGIVQRAQSLTRETVPVSRAVTLVR